MPPAHESASKQSVDELPIGMIHLLMYRGQLGSARCCAATASIGSSKCPALQRGVQLLTDTATIMPCDEL